MDDKKRVKIAVEFLQDCIYSLKEKGMDSFFEYRDGFSNIFFVNRQFADVFLEILPIDKSSNISKYLWNLSIKSGISEIEVKSIIDNLENILTLIKNSSIDQSVKIIQLMELIPQIKSYFHKSGGFETIYGNEKFEQWLSDLKYELDKLKADKLIEDIYSLIRSFNGWNDKITFTQLTAKLTTLKENIDKYSQLDSEVYEMSNKKIFIVHGRNESVLNNIELFIRRIDLEPIILKEQANKGMTIIEKIEANTDVSFAIVLYTACDEGRLKGETDLRSRARQNVVFEHGYMVAKLGRNNVVALMEKGVEEPGDLSGIIYISLEDNNWKHKVAKELEEAGLNINWKNI